jgi:hypothetical protein
LLPEAKTVWGGATMGLLLVGGVVQRWRKRSQLAASCQAE